MPMMIIDIAKRAKAGRDKPGAYSSEEDSEGEDTSGLDEVEKSAAEDMFQAIKDDDQDAFTSALGDYVQACIERHKAEPPPKE